MDWRVLRILGLTCAFFSFGCAKQGVINTVTSGTNSGLSSSSTLAQACAAASAPPSTTLYFASTSSCEAVWGTGHCTISVVVLSGGSSYTCFKRNPVFTVPSGSGTAGTSASNASNASL